MIPGVGTIATIVSLDLAGAEAIDKRNAGLQAVASKMSKMSPVMQSVYNCFPIL